MFVHYQSYISIELLFLNKFVLIKRMHQQSMILITIRISYIMFKPNRCHDLLTMFMNLSNIAILNIKSSYYRCIISDKRKNEDLNLIQIVDLTRKPESCKS